MHNAVLVALAAAGMAGGVFGKLLPVEIYEKGGGDVDCSAKYTVQECVREAKGAPTAASFSRAS